ncbi:MAG: hypothetical protein OXF41_09045 [bacterium]|nr:hypothetical protein [bacterium]
MVTVDKHTGVLFSPVEALEGFLQCGGTTILEAAFQHSFFVDSARVRAKTPFFPERARMSRKHYPGVGRGQQADWEGRPVTIGDNGYAQQAWQRYTGRTLERGSGYSVRHVWGHPWDPDAFTAGWNLCYMPFWAGMLTEKQHPHPQLEQAVRQASWDLYFRDDPVCAPPGFVEDPGMDLDSALGGQPLLILEGTTDPTIPPRPGRTPRRVRPVEFRLWGQSYPVRYGNEVLLGVARCLYRAHLDGFSHRILTLSWASRDGGSRWKEVPATGIFLNVNFNVDKLIRRSHSLLELFGHSPSDLEVVYD